MPLPGTEMTEKNTAERRLAAQHAAALALAESASLGDATPRILRAICGSLGWAHGALLTTYHGDTTMATLGEVEAFAAGGGARVQR